MIKLFLYILNFLLCLWLFMFLPQSLEYIVIVTVITLLLATYNMLTMYKGRLSLSSVLLIYTIFTQFGLIVPYFFLGSDIVNNYEYWTLAFLTSGYLGSAILLGNIGVLSYDIARIVCMRIHSFNCDVRKIEDSLNKDLIAKNSTLLIFSVVLYFMYFILTGGMKLFGTYGEYMASPVSNNYIYHYILIVFYAGILYLSVSGTIKERIVGWSLWFIVVVIFAINGNKGEFLYSLLAVFGLKGVLGQQISKSMIFAGALMIFVIIPSITILRDYNIADNLSNVSGSAFGAFTEMGMQLRTSVYTLENIENGTFDYLYGQSYWQPLQNMLTPFMEHENATAMARREFPGFGYNQVIESYLNFGVLGVISFFSIVGYLLCKYENSLRELIQLAFLGTITCVLINASRNYFSFVPGQIVIMCGFYIFFKRQSQKSCK